MSNPKEMKTTDEEAVVTTDSFSSLPPEVLVRIFSFLGPSDVFRRVSLVCKRFRDVVKEGGIWTEIVVPEEMSFAMSCRWIQSCSKSLRRLALVLQDTPVSTREWDSSARRWAKLAEINVIAICALQQCPNLESLAFLSGFRCTINITTALMQSIDMWGKSLRRLRVDLMGFEFFKASAHCLRNLTSLVVGNDSAFGIEPLADHCIRLEELAVIDDHDPSRRLNAVDRFLEKCHGTLRRLQVIELHADSYKWLGKCRHLEHLTITRMDWEDSIVTTISKLPNLKLLSLSSNSWKPSSSLGKLFADGGLQGLVNLSLDKVSLTNDDLESISSCCKILATLYLAPHKPKKSLEKGLKSILNNCPDLRSLNLEKFPFRSEVFKDVAAPRLRELIVRYWPEGEGADDSDSEETEDKEEEDDDEDPVPKVTMESLQEIALYMPNLMIKNGAGKNVFDI